MCLTDLTLGRRRVWRNSTLCAKPRFGRLNGRRYATGRSSVPLAVLSPRRWARLDCRMCFEQADQRPGLGDEGKVGRAQETLYSSASAMSSISVMSIARATRTTETTTGFWPTRSMLRIRLELRVRPQADDCHRTAIPVVRRVNDSLHIEAECQMRIDAQGVVRLCDLLPSIG